MVGGTLAVDNRPSVGTSAHGVGRPDVDSRRATVSIRLTGLMQDVHLGRKTVGAPISTEPSPSPTRENPQSALIGRLAHFGTLDCDLQRLYDLGFLATCAQSHHRPSDCEGGCPPLLS